MALRPYFKSEIDELEMLFRASPDNRELLEALKDELRHRHSPRAKAVLIKVEKTLEAGCSRSSNLEKPSGDSKTPFDNLVDFAELSPKSMLPTPGADSILAAWTTLEVLSPQPLPEPGDFQVTRRQLFRLNDQDEPWAQSANWKRSKERSVYWFIYLGEIDIAAASQSLLRLFPDENADERADVSGSTTMAAMVLDGHGRPVEGKTFISSFAWGYGQVRAGRLSKLASFPEAERLFRAQLEKQMIRQDGQGEILPVRSRDIERVTAWLVKALNLPPEEADSGSLTIRVPVLGGTDEVPEPELLNSFFIEDLTRVRTAFRTDNVGAALSAYLSSEPKLPRRDVVEEPGILEEVLAPLRIPLARWPGHSHHPLVLMQQAAINHAANELGEGGIIGVNGPPGTGKTTLLRDIVAKVMLDRAIAMAEYKNPLDAFTFVAKKKMGSAYIYLHKLDERLQGHEIVVASSNNKAVENICREIPSMKELADDLSPPLRYFSSVADCVAANGRDEEITEGTSWGLAAAVLGNAANKYAFTQAFWWHEKWGFRRYLRAIVDGWDPAHADDDEKIAPVVLKEQPPINEADALERWILARKEFQAIYNRAQEIALRFEAARKVIRQKDKIGTELDELEHEIARLAHDMAGTRQESRMLQDKFSRVRAAEVASLLERDEAACLRPGFFARIFWTRSYRKWRQLRKLLAQRQKHLGRLSAVQASLEPMRAVAGDRLPDAAFWTQDPKDLQRSSPWLAEEFLEARDALFAAAFRLHRAFIDVSAKRLQHNLSAAMALMKGLTLSDAEEPTRRSIWSSLFMVVPVISTTFASTARLFGPLGREKIGWLLIDEAGQAIPQAAVGAIWRSHRVIGIGDPLQIEPVVTVPPRLVRAIFNEFKVSTKEWAAPLSSVQSLADRTSWFGTRIRQEDGDIWVGCPLRVHRRCQEPMFSISNNIAYNGLMVQNTPLGTSDIGNYLGESVWIDIEGGGRVVGKWSQSEGDAASQLLIRLLDAGMAEPDIFFITPFRIVAQNLRKMFNQNPTISRRLPANPTAWVNDRVGTVHTFQGKQAEAVVLVLGAPLDQSAGARTWAAHPPNLLNVAVSRAKHRLYVIGSYKVWSNIGVFRTLARNLPRTGSA